MPAAYNFAPPVYPLTQPILNGNSAMCANFNGLNQYFIAVELIVDASSPQTLVCYKSIDGGITKTRIAPGIPANYVVTSNVCCVYHDPIITGNLIYIGFMGNETDATRGHLKYTTFNMVTNTWGTIHDSGTNFTVADAVPIDFFIFKMTATRVILIWDQGPGTPAIHFQIELAGVWGAPGTINGVLQVQTLQNCVALPSGHIGVFWFQFLPNDLMYTHISNLGAVGTPFTADPASPLFVFNNPTAGFYDPITDSACWLAFDPSPATILLSVSPSHAPVATIKTTINTDPNNQNMIAMTKDGAGTYHVIWDDISTETATHGQLKDNTSLSILGPWNPAVILYDAFMNALPPIVNLYQFLPMYVSKDPNSGLVIISFGVIYVVAPGTMAGVMNNIPGIAGPPPVVPIIVKQIDQQKLAILSLPNPLLHCPSDENYVMGRVTPKTQKRKRSKRIYDFRSK